MFFSSYLFFIISFLCNIATIKKTKYIYSVFGWSNSVEKFIFSRNLKWFMIKQLDWIEYLKGDLIFGIFMNHFDWLKKWNFKFSKKIVNSNSRFCSQLFLAQLWMTKVFTADINISCFSLMLAEVFSIRIFFVWCQPKLFFVDID